MSSAIESLLEMGFQPREACEKALAQGKGSIEQAIAILSAGPGDDPMEVDEELNATPSSVLDAASSSPPASAPVSQSWRCKETGKLFRTMADVQMYAERTGRSDFEETTELVKPRTAEQLAADQAKLKLLIKKKQAERALANKKRAQEAEKQRRKGGQNAGQVKEEMEKKIRMQRIKEKKKEKLKVAAERDRLRREIAKDKAERKARGGKLAGKMSAEGYNPAGMNLNAQATAEETERQKRAGIEERRKILAKGGVKGFEREVEIPKEERLKMALTALGIQKARDAGKIALMTARKMLHRIVTNPEEAKYRSVNLQNDTLKRKVTSKPGGLNLLVSAGFIKDEAAQTLAMKEVDAVWVQSVIDQAGVVLAKLQ